MAEAVRACLAAAPGFRQVTAVPARSGAVDIGIPFFNGADHLERCLESLLPTLEEGDTVWLLDDGSEDADAVRHAQRFLQAWPSTRLLRHERNLGYLAACNRLLGETTRDVVLLNSDTRVTPGWLAALQDCLARHPGAGIACPLSDRATLLSVLPEGEADETLLAAAAGATAGDIRLPTAVGFCMLIRRALVEDIGAFSPVFDPGYGEENDFSMRALRAGWDILAADRACVYHHSGGSFGSTRSRDLQRAHGELLDRIWPEYAPMVQAWWRENPFRARIEHLAHHGDPRPGIVHVLHRQSLIGGTERVARTLVESLASGFRQTLVYPGKTDGAWCDFETRPSSGFRELMFNQRWIRPSLRVAGHGADLSCGPSERGFARLLRGAQADLVHFHHLLHWDSLLLPEIARAMGCRVVVSVHDFWFNCPNYNQIEPATGRPCRRARVQADRRCADCLGAITDGSPDSARYAEARQQLLGRVLEGADRVLAPSGFLRNRLLAAFPELDPERVLLHPHGVKLPRHAASTPSGSSKVVAFLGGDQVLKGAGLLLGMAEAMVGEDVTFRVFGRKRGFEGVDLPPNVELKGYYHPDRVGDCLDGVHLAVLPSFFEESFSLAASECWAHGVPVLSSPHGAMRERVIPGRNGWLVEDMRPETWIGQLRAVLRDDVLDRCRASLQSEAVRSLEQASVETRQLYDELLAGARRSRPVFEGEAVPDRFTAMVGQLRAQHARNRRTLARGRCLGIMRDRWAPAHYRVGYPLQDLQRAHGQEVAELCVLKDPGFDLGRVLSDSVARRVLIQPLVSDAGLRIMESLHREAGLEIVLVIDDLWTDLPDYNPVRAMLPDDVADRLRYLAAMSHVLVYTTEELRRRTGLGGNGACVIPNALPDWVWSPAPQRPEPPARRLRVGWAGAPQHAGDLAFLADVMRATRDLADWCFLGMCPEPLRELAAEVEPMVPFSRYPEALSGMGLDLALAPLADHPFNRCKSALKLLEHGILATPVVAADLEPYRDAPVALARPDDATDWIAEIRRLLEDHELRLEKGRELQRWVLDHHRVEHRRPAWQRVMGVNADAV